MPVNYVVIENPAVPVDSNHVTIEGADVSVRAKEDRATRVEDYLGIGNPLIYR